MTQPEALRLADELDAYHTASHHKEAAAELRRLHAELERCKQVCAATAEGWRKESEQTAEAHLKQGLTITELYAQRDDLLEALKKIEPIFARMYGLQASELPPMQMVRAAIAKAEGEKT